LPTFRALITLAGLLLGFSAHASTLTIFGAASLTDALPAVVEAWKKTNPGVDVKLNFDGTSRLVSQIEQGMPADLFFSADMEWMDKLARNGKVVPGTRKDILTNEIVLIVPAGAPAPKSAKELASPTFKKIALAGENVPISKYAKAAFEHLQVWSAIEPRIVRGMNVRSILKWVHEKDVDAGVVYRTDAMTDKNVTVAFTFPMDSYPPVIYPGAVIKGSKSEALAKSFLEFCRSKDAMAIFKRMGFN
jgi:molybdate transport system substrate-binding protein